MIFSYGYSIVGKSHITKGTCCQDSHMIKELDNGWIVAAVADGVGSAKNSQIGSSIAAKTVVEFCAEYMPWDYSLIGIKSMLRTAYNYAFKQIIREAEKTGEPLESYDTTLTIVIYDGHRIIYGHSGDGAIIGLNVYGNYVQITKPQKGADMVSVLPLRSGYTAWTIDSYEDDLVAVMLMTDGMLDYALCPYLLKQSTKSEVYTPIATFFADPYGIPRSGKKAEKTRTEIKEFITADENYDANKFYARLKSIYTKHLNEDADELISKLKETNYPLAFMQSVQDDKTMVAIINTDMQFDTREIDYFAEPNWDELQEEWNKKAYPHLYEQKTVEDSESDTKGNELSNFQAETSQSTTKKDIEKQEESCKVNSDDNHQKEQTSTTTSKSLQGKSKEFVDKKMQQPATTNEPPKSDSCSPQVKTNMNLDEPTITIKPTTQHPTKHEKPKKKGGWKNCQTFSVNKMSNYNGFAIIKKSLSTTFQFYRSTLQADEKSCYDKMVLGIVNYNRVIQIGRIEVNQLNKIFNYIKLDNPLLFFVKELSVKYEPRYKRAIVIPQYRFDKKTANDNIVALLSKMKKILLPYSKTDDFKAEKGIHDYICSNIHYDMSFAESSYECVGPILFQKGVCEGISKAAKLLCDFLGLKCIVVHGIATDTNINLGTNAHTWNKICVNENFYNLDITFDLTISSSNLIRYDYFNITDCEILNDHRVDSNQLPACVANACYYSISNQTFKTPKEIQTYLLSEISKNNKIIVFKVANDGSNSVTETKILQCINLCSADIKKIWATLSIQF